MSAINATATPTIEESAILAGITNIIISARSELLLFVAAMAAYFVLFMQRTPPSPKKKTKKVPEEDFKEEDYPTDAYTNGSIVDPRECAGVEKALRDAF